MEALAYIDVYSSVKKYGHDPFGQKGPPREPDRFALLLVE